VNDWGKKRYFSKSCQILNWQDPNQPFLSVIKKGFVINLGYLLLNLEWWFRTSAADKKGSNCWLFGVRQPY
jgi:hypothetical protein